MKPSTKIIVIVISSILELFLLVGGVLYGVRASVDPADAVISFSEYFNTGEYKKMLRYVDPSEAKLIKGAINNLPEAVSKSAFETILPFISDVTNTKLYPEIISVNQEKKRAVVTVKFKKLDDENYYDVYLSKKNGIWYIKYFWLSSDK